MFRRRFRVALFLLRIAVIGLAFLVVADSFTAFSLILGSEPAPDGETCLMAAFLIIMRCSLFARFFCVFRDFDVVN